MMSFSKKVLSQGMHLVTYNLNTIQKILDHMIHSQNMSFSSIKLYYELIGSFRDKHLEAVQIRTKSSDWKRRDEVFLSDNLCHHVFFEQLQASFLLVSKFFQSPPKWKKTE